jgi:DNA-binding response OmpR family regulator
MLPKKNGIAVCKILREENVKIPILMLTAKSQVEDKILGLDSGADDYLTKPFAFAELKARINALIRRSYNEVDNTVAIDNLKVDLKKRIVIRSNKEIKLTPKEFSILELLLRHKDETVTRTQILEHVWDYNYEGISNVVDVFVTTLRKKIDKDFAKQLIQTIHGVGYKISENQ